MTTLLEKAVSKAKKLSAAEQNALAKLMLDEIESEKKWEQSLTKSPQKMAKLADKAWAEHTSGASQPLDPDRL